MDDNERAARAREDAKRESERLASSKEVFNWVTQFNRTQAMQIDQDVMRAERARADAPAPEYQLPEKASVEPARASETPFGGGAVDAWLTGRDGFDGDAEGRARSREVFDWVTQFNRTQAMQIEQDVLRAERAKVDGAGDAGGGAVDAWLTGRDGFDRDGEGRARSREVFDWVTQFNRTQAMQIEQDVLRAERAKVDGAGGDAGGGSGVVDPEPAEVGPVGRGAVDAWLTGREGFDRDGEGRARSREVFDWVTQFNRTQAMQIEQDVLRAERAKVDGAGGDAGGGSGVVDPEPAEVGPVGGGAVDAWLTGREEFDRDGEGRARSREVFDWVTQFNRTQAMQIEQDVLRAERAKVDSADGNAGGGPGVVNPEPAPLQSEHTDVMNGDGTFGSSDVDEGCTFDQFEHTREPLQALHTSYAGTDLVDGDGTVTPVPDVRLYPTGDLFGSYEALKEYLRSAGLSGSPDVEEQTWQAHHLLETTAMNQFGINPQTARTVAMSMEDHSQLTHEQLSHHRKVGHLDEYVRSVIASYEDAGRHAYAREVRDFVKESRTAVADRHAKPDLAPHRARVLTFIDEL